MPLSRSEKKRDQTFSVDQSWAVAVSEEEAIELYCWREDAALAEYGRKAAAVAAAAVVVVDAVAAVGACVLPVLVVLGLVEGVDDAALLAHRAWSGAVEEGAGWECWNAFLEQGLVC